MKKYKNNILYKNIIILLVSGTVAKIIGMIGKIIYTRTAGINIVSLYALIMPTLMLIISITQFSFPISISKISAEEKYENQDILKNAYYLGIIIDIIIIIIILLTSNTIASLLHNNVLKSVIRSISFIIPFITISSILRGFLHGKEDMLSPSISNIVEEIIKIILIILVLPIAIAKSSILSIIFIILFNVFTELISIIIMNDTIKKKYLNNKESKININIIKDIIKISFPSTMIRLVSAVGLFLEPILLTYVLIRTGYKLNYITLQYGIINSYILPLLSIPTFFSTSVAAALLPNITKAYTNKEYKLFNNKLIKLIIISLLVGIISLTIILLFPSQIIEIIYNIKINTNYLYLLGPFFLLIYIQPTLSVSVQAMNKTNKLFYVSIITNILKYLCLYILGINDYGINSLIYAIMLGIILTTLMLLIIIIKELSNKT